MKTRLVRALAVGGALSGLELVQCAPKQSADGVSAAERPMENFVGAWRLAWMEEPGPDGTMIRIADRRG